MVVHLILVHTLIILMTCPMSFEEFLKTAINDVDLVLSVAVGNVAPDPDDLNLNRQPFPVVEPFEYNNMSCFISSCPNLFPIVLETVASDENDCFYLLRELERTIQSV